MKTLGFPWGSLSPRVRHMSEDAAEVFLAGFSLEFSELPDAEELLVTPLVVPSVVPNKERIKSLIPICVLLSLRCDLDLWGSLSTGVEKLPQRSFIPSQRSFIPSEVVYPLYS